LRIANLFSGTAIRGCESQRLFSALDYTPVFRLASLRACEPAAISWARSIARVAKSSMTALSREQ